MLDNDKAMQSRTQSTCGDNSDSDSVYRLPPTRPCHVVDPILPPPLDPSPHPLPQTVNPYQDTALYSSLAAWTPASTRIPEELLDDILLHVIDKHRQNHGAAALQLGGSRYGSNTLSLKNIMACSLVCRHWANQCRKLLFSKAVIKLVSPEDAEAFIKYAAQERRMLVPIRELISAVRVEQRFSTPYSFCWHLRHLESTVGRSLKSELSIIGPIPSGFPLDAPYWGTPPSTALPPSLRPYNDIILENLHLPSFMHVAQYVECIQCASTNMFNRITWNAGADRGNRPVLSTRGPSHICANDTMFVHADNCTNSFRICLQVASTHSLSLMHSIMFSERERMILLMIWFRETWIIPEFESDTNDVECTITSERPKKQDAPSKTCLLLVDSYTRWAQLSFLLQPDEYSQVEAVGNANLRVACCKISFSSHPAHIELDSDDEKSYMLDSDEEDEDSDEDSGPEGKGEHKIDIDTLMTYLRHFPRLGTIILTFDNYDDLVATMGRYRPTSFDHLLNGCRYIIACMRSDAQTFAEVPGDDEYILLDPITLIPTGRSLPMNSVVIMCYW